MNTDNKISAIQYAISLIGRGMAENAYDGIALPKLPEHTLQQLEMILEELRQQRKEENE